MANTTYHTAALQQECIHWLNIQPDGVYVDVTFGGGGHSSKILQFLTDGKLFAFDQDIDTKNHLPKNPNFEWIHSNFSEITHELSKRNVTKVNGILADIGVSFHQFDAPERGFSFRFPKSPLDMRMNQNQSFTAADLLNSYSESQLADVFYWYGEIKSSRKIAALIAEYRKIKQFVIVENLIDVCKNMFSEHTIKSYLPQVFQAIRIEVNQELAHLKSLLVQSKDLLTNGGRLVVLTWHSLEDRIVKNFMKSGNFEGEVQKDFYGNPMIPFQVLTKKPVVPSKQEIEQNPRSRSAKLRVIQKN